MTQAPAAPTMTPDQALAARDVAMQSMGTIRWLTMRLIENLTIEQWLHQVADGANHIMFNIGHIACTDEAFLRAAGGASQAVPASYTDLFQAGRQPSPRPADYPPPEEVVGVLQQIRQQLTTHLAGLPAEQLLAPLQNEGLRNIVPTLAHLPGFITLHEASHSGQILLIRRTLGLPGVLGQAPAE
ncbi:MAG: DinB family protein [Phycisphaerales bacterium JB039]